MKEKTLLKECFRIWLSYPFPEGMVALTGAILYKKSVGGKRNVQGNAKEKTNIN